MSRQLDLLNSESEEGKVIPTALHTEMQQSYLEYAMSVIVGRALPDVRDGLKPVHRRILFAMHELGLLPDRPFRKCARVVGDVLGKYHPHGDQSVYDALVRLVQDFSTRYPLLAGHGNFGSVDNDPPAAMRYTECRLAGIGHSGLLTDIDENIVDFTDNFDGSQREPTVLPAQLPIVVLNGATGIAVGMATNIPPHNLGEVVDALIALIDQPDLKDEKLFSFIPAPDFPTGGVIVDDGNVQETYRSGRGSITIRGVANLEEVALSKTRKRTAIVVTELPFQVNKATWIEKVAELVNQGRLEGIADLRDESDRSGMRVVMELKKDTIPDNLLEQLYRLTALQINFGAILLALVNRRPCQLSLRQLLQEFLQFRETTLLRRYNYEHNQAQKKLHLVEGLTLALGQIDRIIATIRESDQSSTARAQLQSRFELSQAQADAILAMPLRRLTGLEQASLQQERSELTAQISRLAHLIENRPELLKALKKELRQLKKQFGDDRRTRIISRQELTPINSLPVLTQELESDVMLHFSYRGYVRRWDFSPRSVTEDPTVLTLNPKLEGNLLLFSSAGQAFSLVVKDIPPMPRQARSKGTPLLTLLPDKIERIVSTLDPESEGSLVLLTAQGRIKRVDLTEFGEITARGLVAVKLKEQDSLIWAEFIPIGGDIVIATPKGRMIRIPVSDEFVPLQGRAAIGNQALKLKPGETLMGAAPVLSQSRLLLITAQGYVKCIAEEKIRPSPKGGLGVQGIGFKSPDDYLTLLYPIGSDRKEIDLLISRSQGDFQSRITTLTIPAPSSKNLGEPLIEIAAGERVVAVLT